VADIFLFLVGHHWPRRRRLQHQNVHTTQLAYGLGQEAARRKVAAYIRMQNPFYECTADKTDKPAHSERDALKPENIRGAYWHETLRVLGAIKE